MVLRLSTLSLGLQSFVSREARFNYHPYAGLSGRMQQLFLMAYRQASILQAAAAGGTSDYGLIETR